MPLVIRELKCLNSTACDWRIFPSWRASDGRDGAVNETLKWEQRGGTLFLRLIDAAPLQDSLLSEHWLIKVIK